MTDTFFELLQLSVGHGECLSSSPSSGEWRILLDLAKKHAVVGLCRTALERLPQSQWPPQDIILEWSAICRRIELRNGELNKASTAVAKWFRHKGFRSCILKGQGNAMMYPDPMSRTPGDIDIWVDGGVSQVLSLARETGVEGKAYYHHIEWKSYGNVEVEVHYRPSFMFNPVHNLRLQNWFCRRASAQFSNVVDMPDDAGSISVPDFEFNVVFQLAHISNHFFHEGIGLRQFADYYFLLMDNRTALSNEESCQKRKDLLSHFGLLRFAGAVMWVLERVFLMDRKYMIVEPDNRRGRLLMEEILEGGNFGKYDVRALSGAQRGPLRRNIARIYRDIRLCGLFPSECLWEPCFRVWHLGWRCVH